MSSSRAWRPIGTDVGVAEPGDVAPPWARFPEIIHGSIGWRMGAGEDWICAWADFLDDLPGDREQRLAYLRRHPPAPRNWADTAVWVVEPGLRGDDDAVVERREAVQRELEQAGVIADDVAIVAWLARNDPPEAPWRAGVSLANEVRYGARGLTFFVRWALGRRAEGRLAEWFAAAARPGREWQAFRDALVSGRVEGKLPRDPRKQLAILLAAAGDPPPPWTRGERPAALEQRFEDRTTYAGAWCEWAGDAFDDEATWLAYLRRCPPAPPDWDSAVREALLWLFP